MGSFVMCIMGLLTSLSLESAAAASSPTSLNTPYSRVQAYMVKITQDYPQNASLFNLATADGGEVIQGLKIGHGPVHQLIVSTHHGNEYGATEVGKAMALSLAQNPITDATVYILPVLNISGYNGNNRRETRAGSTFDPNRDYPGPCATEGPFKLKSTAALARFIDQKDIVTSATLHTYSPAVVYPWGLSTHDLSTPYDSLFSDLVKAATIESGYPSGNNTQLIYPADGTFEDYAFWKFGIWSILFELGSSHSPSAGDVAKLIKVNVPGLRRLLTLAPKQRAADHDFKGRCNLRLHSLDRHDE